MVQERDPSNTDSIWNKYTIRVRGFVSQSAGQLPADTSTTLAAIKAQLETPRRPFLYKIDGVTLVTVDGLDAKLGPEPLAASVHEVTSGTYQVEAGVIVRIVACDSVCDAMSPVVSLRWSQTESFDENWYSHLVTVGKLIVRSDLLQSADSFRPLATPPLLTDYIRTRSSYNLSMDGTQLDFHFDDIERDRLPPFPATKASGKFIIMLEKGAKRTGQVDIHLEGPKGTGRRELMIRALQMAYSKLWPECEGMPGLPIINMTVKEDLFDPIVDVTVSCNLKVIDKSSKWGALSGAPDGPGPVVCKWVGLPPAGVASNQPGISPPTRKRLQALLAAAFRDPCACDGYQTEMSTTNRGVSGAQDMKSIPLTANVFSLSIGATLPPADNVINSNPTSGLTKIIINTRQEFSQNDKVLPGTGVGPNGDIGTKISTGGKSCREMVAFVAQSFGKPPEYPNPLTLGNNAILVYSHIMGLNVRPSVDGSSVEYNGGGFYLYDVINPLVAQLKTIQPYDSSLSVNNASKSGFTSFMNASLQAAATAGVTAAQPNVPGGVAPNPDPQIPPSFLPAQLGPSPIVGIGGFQDLGGAPPNETVPNFLDNPSNSSGTSIFENAGDTGNVPQVPVGP